MFTCILCSPAERALWFLQRSLATLTESRAPSRRRLVLGLCAGVITLVAGVALAAESVYPLEVLPPECKLMTDPQTGAELVFLTR